MAYQTSNFAGDAAHSINCTGDCVVGDHVAFERATFTGSLRRPKFAGLERVTGTIVADSYGATKQQHTFTIALEAGGRTLIKGRNLYANGVWRQPWADEGARHAAAAEKHRRGDAARARRAQRIEETFHASL